MARLWIPELTPYIYLFGDTHQQQTEADIQVEFNELEDFVKALEDVSENIRKNLLGGFYPKKVETSKGLPKKSKTALRVSRKNKNGEININRAKIAQLKKEAQIRAISIPEKASRKEVIAILKKNNVTYVMQ